MKTLTAIAFDATTARIVHMHHFVSATGEVGRTREQLQAIVRRDLAERGHRDGSVEIAFVEQALDQPHRYRFDQRTKRLISGDSEGVKLNSAAGLRGRL
jgi:hypothetical protein